MKYILLSIAALLAALAIAGCVVGPGQYEHNGAYQYDPAAQQTQEDAVRDSNADAAAAAANSAVPVVPPQ